MYLVLNIKVFFAVFFVFFSLKYLFKHVDQFGFIEFETNQDCTFLYSVMYVYVFRMCFANIKCISPYVF